MNVIDVLNKEQLKANVPEFRPGDTVKVYSKVVEGGKERIQMFEGVVTVRKGGGAHESVVVRRVAHGVGVEKTFLLHSPRVDRIELAKRGVVRRSRLYYLSDKIGKAARIKESHQSLSALTPLQLLGLVAVFAVARVTLSIKPIAADDQESSAVAVVRGYLDAFIIAGLAAMLLITFVIRTFYIPSISMIPTLQVHDVLLVDELAYHLHQPASGDVAVFMPPIDSAGNEFIKRVIGVPGDTIAIHDGIVYRNGKALSEPYENEQPKYDLEIKKYGIYVDGVALDPKNANIPPRSQWSAPNRVPAGFYLMLGDNRNYSDDSHVWGFTTKASFFGRAFFIFWPLNRFSIIH